MLKDMCLTVLCQLVATYFIKINFMILRTNNRLGIDE